MFWSNNNSNNTQKWKINAYKAVIRSKLLYGLKTIHLTKLMIKKLDAFYLRGLRKILDIPTIYRQIDPAPINLLSTKPTMPLAMVQTTKTLLSLLSFLVLGLKIKGFHHSNISLELTIKIPSDKPLTNPTQQIQSSVEEERLGGPKQHWTYQTNRIYYDSKLAYGGCYDNSNNQNSAIYSAAFTAANRAIPANNNPTTTMMNNTLKFDMSNSSLNHSLVNLPNFTLFSNPTFNKSNFLHLPNPNISNFLALGVKFSI